LFMEKFSVGTLVTRNMEYGIWAHGNSPPGDYFTEVGVIFEIRKHDVKVRWPGGEWFRYSEPHRNFIIVEPTKQWSLPDELFEI
jgi:hypothetical protein